MKALIVVAGVMLCVAGTGAQDLSSADIAAAIEQGRAGKTLQKKCSAQSENGFDIVIEGPIGRIMRGARDAKRQHREFTAGDAATLGRPELTVFTRRDSTLATQNVAVVPTPHLPGIWGVAPDMPNMDYLHSKFTMGFSYGIDVALKSKPSDSNPPIVLKPLRHSAGLRPGRDMTASFDLASFRNLPAGKVEVVIFMTDAGEHRCGLSEKDRRRLR